METETATNETTATTETYESPSMGDMLSGKSNAGGSEGETESPAPAAETPQASEDQAAPTQAAATTPEASVTPPPAPQAAPPAIDPEILRAEVAKATKGLLGAIQTERQKRQALEQQMGGMAPIEEADQRVDSLKKQLLTQSETLMRLQHKDYDEVTSHFYAEAANNPALAQTVLESDVPALAAYETGQSLKLAKKYGPEVLGNPAKLAEKLRAEMAQELRASITKELESTLHAKARERANTPTNISEARAAGGGEQPYRSPGLAALLKKATRR